jgi:hypothetical protein
MLSAKVTRLESIFGCPEVAEGFLYPWNLSHFIVSEWEQFAPTNVQQDIHLFI